MPKSLSEGQQRLVFGALVVALVACGIYLSVAGIPGGGSDSATDPNGSTGAERGQDTDQPAAVAPSPIPATAAEDMRVLDWFPFTEDEFKAAAATAQGFAEAYGTIDYSESPEAYFQSMEELATEEYAQTLAQSSGAGAHWQEMREQEAVAEGRANVESVRSFDDRSIVFVLTVQSITEGEGGATEDLGEYSVTVMEDGGEWRVFDFQPADAGNLGDR
ncbi:hypothetical protein LG943_23650 [Streptomonospora sp. S1-112]|uniref:Uncharacterized protein n=1 Tax=Streptomonospora mangrovi TaxID=2883123 RepID=A0A9X3NUU5_9ACTN|nr:hypothetical protein [Streptomonospora mangrovi]MDA0567290.1 hypothetical protein [Streptomonospora mangrovi]